MARKTRETYIKEAFTHRRTKSDYRGSLMDVVTLEIWREMGHC